MKAIITALFLFVNAATYAQNNASVNLQQIIDTFIVNNKIPAIAVAVVQLDTVMYAVSGVNSTVNGTPISTTAKFHLGSNSKAFTSFMAAKLVEEGKLTWTTQLVDVMPELKSTIQPKFQHITLEQLLSHTAGIKPFTNEKEYHELLDFEKNIKNISERQFLIAKHTLANDTLLTVGQFKYSNMGYLIAALMLERIANKSWAEQLKETIKQNNLGSAFIGFPNKETATNPWGHSTNDSDTLQTQSPTFDYDLSIIAPAGNISMNIKDYSKFIQLNLQGLCGSDNYLKSDSYQTLHYGKKAYSLGWMNGKNPVAGAVNTHDGSAGNFYAHTMIFKEKKMAIIVLANASSPSIDKAVVQMRRYLFNLYGVVK